MGRYENATALSEFSAKSKVPLVHCFNWCLSQNLFLFTPKLAVKHTLFLSNPDFLRFANILRDLLKSEASPNTATWELTLVNESSNDINSAISNYATYKILRESNSSYEEMGIEVVSFYLKMLMLRYKLNC